LGGSEWQARYIIEAGVQVVGNKVQYSGLMAGAVELDSLLFHDEPMALFFFIL
jgi:hypothetical protein